MKKYFFIILLIMIMPFKILAHEQLSDGWQIVKNIEKTDNCKLNYVWAYYKNGVEQSRYCRLIRLHRAWGGAPENSLEAIKMTREKGYYAYETDIQFTKDNVAVLSHDSTINRIARNKDYSKLSKTIKISETNLSDLKNYIFVVTRTGVLLKDKQYANNPITTFKEALDYSKKNGMFISIELKTGTASQIASLVKMVKDSKMENSVNYLSFQATLLKYVKDVDPYANLYLIDLSYYTSTGTCDPKNEKNKDYYCKSITEKGKDEGEEQRKKFHEMLDTEHNYVRLDGDPSNDKGGQGTISGANLPDRIEDFPNDKYKLSKLIKKPTLNLDKKKISIETGKSLNIKYSYDGDGTVKCLSPDKKYVTCSVDNTNKTITVKVIKTLVSDNSIKIYATQGVNYNATSDITLTVSKNNELKGDVDGNGKIGSSDYILIRKYILKTISLNSEQLKKADVDSDGKVGSSDYVAIRKLILK